LADDAALARTLRADGVHLKSGVDIVERFDEARSILGAGAIVGCDAGGSRHLAMQLGEAGADYVGFSRVDGADDQPVKIGDDDEVEDFGPRRQDALIAWWSQVFEVPCVAFDATTPEVARTYSELGADFVAVTFGGGESVPASVERLKAFVRAVEDAHVA
jgi:thiamine-phosphate pyrophosphorylase